ncbi:unnamed protein product [Cylindrotheca closterium]|uniref:Uncharacterized protein n=1 Tax=Cylindrotheca closterium TaxID=2856 RepID=A0AAD2G430_9STRA|nr:unnamed protein product [Cylindrotheca closterium]
MKQEEAKMCKPADDHNSTSETFHHSRPSLDRSQGTLSVCPPPKAAPIRHPRYEKRISIDLMPMTLEEIEWAMGDAKIQEEEREIQEIRERLRKRKQAKVAAAAAAMANAPTSSRE